MGIVARGGGGGIDLELELEGPELMPGRLAPGTLRIAAREARDIRGAYVTLVGVEHWKHEVTEHDSEGRPRTRIVRREADLPRVPVQLLRAMRIVAGGSHKVPFELPVPGLGPPSVDADVCGVAWTLEAKIDVPGFDPGVALPVRVHQPTALLRAGVVPVGQFALWPSADAVEDGIQASLALDPVPLDLGASFSGRIALEAPSGLDVQEVRAEVVVRAEATVSSGLREEIVVWRAQLAGPGKLPEGSHEMAFRGELPAMALPTAKLPHGRTSATFRVVLARSWRRDPNLVRDVALATTTEV